MKTVMRNFYETLSLPLSGRARLVIALLVIPLLLAFVFPLWRISMEAPQYPLGLSMDIYPHTVVGGHDNADIKEINILNHYIGMHPIDRAQLSDLDWLPFAIGGLTLLALRCAVVGNVRSLIDLFVLTGYFCAFAMGRFVYKLYTYGHVLDPNAPVKIPGFTPALFGTKQIANFTTHSFPQLGAIGILVFALGLAIVSVAQFVRRRGEVEPELHVAEPAPA